MTLLKSILLSLLMLSGSSLFAQWVPTGNLTIFSEDGAKFYLILNGERYNDVAQTNIRIEELPNPYYNCKIIFEDQSLPGLSKSRLMLADVDGRMQDVTYRIKRDNKGRNVLRFYSFVPAVQNMARPAGCVVYRYGAPNIALGIDRHDDFRRNMRNQRGDRNESISRNDRESNPLAGRSGCNSAMNSQSFNEAKATIAGNSFEETKLSVARQILSANCMSAGQITTILSVFSFEASKLEFAKYAYSYCTDRNNYFKVSNAFTFESSKTELNNYIQSVR